MRTKGGNLNGYIFMIAKNEVVNYYRSRQQIIAYQKDFVEDVRIEARIDESIDSKRLAAVIERIVAALPRTRREVFIMSRYRHMSNAEIALHLGDFETHGRETHQPRTGKTAHGEPPRSCPLTVRRLTPGILKRSQKPPPIQHSDNLILTGIPHTRKSLKTAPTRKNYTPDYVCPGVSAYYYRR